MNTVRSDIVWTRPRSCESSSCPEWQVDPDDGTVWLRNSATPDRVIKFRRDEWDMLIGAAANGEVVTVDG